LSRHCHVQNIDIAIDAFFGMSEISEVDLSNKPSSLSSSHGLLPDISEDLSSKQSQEKIFRTSDQLIPIWILVACSIGLGLGQLSIVSTVIEKTTTSSGTNILVGLGLMMMMYPPLGAIIMYLN